MKAEDPRRAAEDGTILVVLAAIALLVIAGAVLFLISLRQNAASAEAEFADKVGPLDVVDYLMQPLDPSENAARLFLEAGGRVVLDTRERSFLSSLERNPETLAPPHARAALRAIVAKNAAALAGARHAAVRQASSFEIDYAAGAYLQLPELEGLFDLATILALHGRLALLEQDRPGVIERIGILGRLSAVLQAEATVHLVDLGLSVETDQLNLVRDFLAASVMDAETCAGLRETLPARDPAAVFRRVIGFATASQWVWRHPPPSAGSVGPGEDLPGPLRDLIVAALTPVFLQEALTCVEWYGLSYPAMLTQLADSDRLPEHDVAGAPPAYLRSVCGPIAGRTHASAAARRLAKVALALRCDRADHPHDAAAFKTLEGAGERQPFTGTPLRLDALPDGKALLVLPEGPETWRRAFPDRQPVPPFAWRLPAKTGPHSNVRRAGSPHA